MITIYIHWLRHVRRYVRSRSRLISSLIQPLLYLLAVGFGLGPTFRAAGQGLYIQFLAPGIIAMAIVFSAVFSGMDLIFDRQFGFLKVVLVSPPSRVLHILGRIAGALTVAMIQGCLVLLISVGVGFRPVRGAAIAFVIMALVALLFSALGQLVGSMVSDFSGFQMFTNVLLWPMLFFSGTLFPLANLPLWLLMIVKSNPFTYGVDGLRQALTSPSGIVVLSTDFVVLSVAATAIVGLSAWRFNRIQL